MHIGRWSGVAEGVSRGRGGAIGDGVAAPARRSGGEGVGKGKCGFCGGEPHRPEGGCGVERDGSGREETFSVERSVWAQGLVPVSTTRTMCANRADSKRVNLIRKLRLGIRKLQRK